MSRASLAAYQNIETLETPIRWPERISAAAYMMVLLWINIYICRNLLWAQTTPMNSMHGFWMAIARWADGGWFHATWWPYWDCGIPFEFTYAPMAPALTAIVASMFRLSYGLSFQWVALAAYCLTPLTIFLAGWLITRAPGYSFLAGLLYSLTSITHLLVPDDAFTWHRFWDARRLYLTMVWDDTPHVLALGFLPLSILFLSLAIRKQRLVYCAAAAVSMAAATLASAFGLVMVGLSVICLLYVLERRHYGRNILLTAAIGIYAYALCARFLPPSLFQAVSSASQRGESGNWSVGSITALALVILGWVIVWHYLPRWTTDWRLQFFALFAYLTTSVPALATFLDRHLLPQPNRYKLEMELAWAWFAVFAARYWIEKMPRAAKAALLFVCLAFGGERIVSHRKYAKADLRAGDLESTIESRAARWAQQNLPRTRILMPGSIAQWANAFAPLQQFTGGPWSMAYNPIQQRGRDAAFDGGETPEIDARVSLAWLKAFSVGAVCVTGPKSPEFWKPYRHPTKFDGLLPVLWSEEDTTIYRISRPAESLAHVVPASAIVRLPPRRPRDTAGLERYNAALDDPFLPPAEFRWEGTNRIRIHTETNAAQVLSVQISYHPGWHATVGSRHPEIQPDGLGLIWFRPGCNGSCDVELDYDGGWELRLFRWISYTALAGLLIGLPAWYFWLRPAAVLGRK